MLVGQGLGGTVRGTPGMPRCVMCPRWEWVGHKLWAQVADVSNRVWLGEVITQVLCTGAPVYFVVAMSHTIPDPMVSHHDSLGAALLDTVRCDATGTFIVCLEGGSSLGVAQIM